MLCHTASQGLCAPHSQTAGTHQPCNILDSAMFCAYYLGLLEIGVSFPASSSAIGVILQMQTAPLRRTYYDCTGTAWALPPLACCGLLKCQTS